MLHSKVCRAVIFVEKQGQVIRVVNLTPSSSPKTPPSTRGNISTFSRKSRRRMIDFLARMDLDQTDTKFITLTFKGTPSPEQAKRALKQFMQGIRRNHPQSSGVWRSELQKRDAIHFHLMMFNLPYWKQADMQKRWEQCTGEPMSIVDVRRMRNGKQTMYYVSKYIAKADTSDSPPSLVDAPYQHNSASTSIGRQWGWLNKEQLPFAKRVTAMIVDEDLAEYFWWTAGALRRKRTGEPRKTQRLYTNDSQAMFDWMLRHGAFLIDFDHHEWLRKRSMGTKTRTKVGSFLDGRHAHL